MWDDRSIEGISRYENVQELLNSIKEFIDNEENEETEDNDDDEINLSLVAMESEIKDQILKMIDEVAKTFKEILTLSERRIARLRKG